MFFKDIELIKELHQKYSFKASLLDAGGLENPTIADYDISIAKAITVNLKLDSFSWEIKTPHPNQNDRYHEINRPWKFIDQNYVILNPEKGDPYIEEMPELYSNSFSTVIMVSVFEHVENPYTASDAIFKILKPGGYFINSTPFIFPYHPSPEDNFRYSPIALKRIHESSGFNWLEGDFHVNYSSSQGVGDTNPKNYGAPQGIMASYALVQKPI